MYLALGVVLFAIAALTIGGYFAQSLPPPAPPAALGTIPAAMTNPAMTNPAMTNPAMTNPAGTPPPGLRDPQANTDLTATRTLPPPPAPAPAPFS